MKSGLSGTMMMRTHSVFDTMVDLETSNAAVNPRFFNSVLKTTNKMQLYTIIFILLSKLYVFQAGSPPIIRSSKTVYTASGIVKLFCCLPLAWVSWNPDTVCTVFEFTMMGGKTA
jgi:hypothetical protein